jgi:RNA recognition motif-containing protein
MSLFVGNISKNVHRQDLIEQFEKFGKCDINIKVQPNPPITISSLL